MDYQVQRCSRHCWKTGREFVEGEEFYSALVVERAEVNRLDYAADAWDGPPEGSLGWWKSRMPSRDSNRLHWAPNDVLLEVFRELADNPAAADTRYVMALLLVRRRVCRLEETEHEDGEEMLVLYCPRDEETYRVPVVALDDARVQAIQDELAALLFADATQ